MAKYHLNKEGNPGACSAKEGNCPFGGEEKHYASKKDAQMAFEKQQGSGLDRQKEFGIRIITRAAKYEKPELYSQLPKKFNEDDLRNASAYAQMNNTLAPISYSEIIENSMSYSPQDYERDEAIGVRYGEKKYMIATPDGGFAEVEFYSGAEGEYDDYWQFHPAFYAEYRYYSDVAAVKNKKAAAESKWLTIPGSDKYERIISGNYDRPSYDKGDLRTIQPVCEKTLRDFGKPNAIAHLARLKGSQKKLSREEVTGSSGFENQSALVRAAAVGRKEFPKDLHADVLEDESMVIAELAKRSDLSKETMTLIYNRPINNFDYDSRFPKRNLLKNPKLPVSFMQKVARHGTIEDMRNLAENPALTEKAKEIIRNKSKELGVWIIR